jgi:acyl carrier protein
MGITTFIQQFADLFEDLDGVTLTPDTKFRDLEEWGSLQAMLTIAMVDAEYGIIISGDDIKTSQTIQDIFDKVAAK